MAGSVVERLGRGAPLTRSERVAVAVVVVTAAALIALSGARRAAIDWRRARRWRWPASLSASHKDLAARVAAEFAQHYNHHDDERAGP